jgi:CBS domain-containing protein/mannitol/fructose-specific phosphotransferase system IIA component (Ntr-type)
VTLLLTELLPPEHIVVPLEASNFRDAVEEIASRLGQLGAIQDVAEVQRILAQARGRDVVAIGADVALPHFRTEAVEELVIGLGISRSELDISGTSLSRSPHIIALVLAPPEAATRYLQAVAALARLFKSPDVVARMASARTAEEILSQPELANSRVQPDLRVRDVMNHRTEGISPKATVREAVDIMLRNGWRALPVLGQKGEVLGIITEWDVMRELLPEIPAAGAPDTADAQARPVLVRDAMTRSVLCVSEEMDIEEAAHMMVNKNVEQFPVVNESVLTGMLSRSDIIRKLFGR